MPYASQRRVGDREKAFNLVFNSCISIKNQCIG